MEVNGSGRLFMFLKALEKEIPFTFFFFFFFFEKGNSFYLATLKSKI
jgi:hypothetical protein